MTNLGQQQQVALLEGFEESWTFVGEQLTLL
jgi:hypothetical protein